MALKTFKLNDKETQLRKSVYDDLDHMVAERERTYPHFNGEYGDRTLVEYINDSNLRLNGNTPTREAQGKEEWQNNLFNPITRVKMKAIIAGVALSVPEQSYKAVNKDGIYSSQRAELTKQLVRHSRLKGNPQLDVFFEAWQTAAEGTVVKFDGYLKQRGKRRFITSYDPATGKVEWKEEEVDTEDCAVDQLVQLSEFFIWDFHIYDVQDQPKVAWVQHYNKSTLEAEFGKYANFKHVHDKAEIQQFRFTAKTYFLDRWANRVEDHDDYEVIRYFNKLEDRYEIWCNGVPLLLAPLVWGKAKKMYPFSKTIFEPFVGQAFFYGKSFPSVIEGIQDVDNTLINSILDKMYRGLDPAMLIGLENKDIFDLEDELITQDNKIYVPNIQAVKPMPVPQVSQSEIALLEYMAKQGDLASVDVSQQGQTGKGVTAREIVIADERARELKGIFYMFLEDLWLQKTRIRILTIRMHYMTPKVQRVIGKDGLQKLKPMFTNFNVPDVEFSDGTMGTLGVQVAKTKNDMLSVPQIEAREQAMQENGVNFKQIAVTSDYLDEWEIEVTTESVANKDRITKEANFEGEVRMMVTLFPEWFADNKELYLKEGLSIYGKNIDDLKKPQPKQPQTLPDGSPLPEGTQMDEQSLLGLEEPANAPTQ